MLEPSKPGAEPEVVKYDATNGKRSIFIGGNQLFVPGTPDRLVVQRFFQTPAADKFYLLTRTGQWLFDTKAGELKKLPDELPQPSAANAFSPQADRILFRRGRNLAVLDIASGNITPLTTDGDRSQLDNGSEMSWSPDGRRIAYLQSDSSKVRLRPVVQPTDPSYPEVTFQRFARVGTPIPTLRVGVADRGAIWSVDLDLAGPAIGPPRTRTTQEGGRILT